MEGKQGERNNQEKRRGKYIVRKEKGKTEGKLRGRGRARTHNKKISKEKWRKNK